MRFVDVPKSKVLETACASIFIEVHFDQDLQDVKEQDTQPLRDLQDLVISALPQSNADYKCDCMGDRKNACVDGYQAKAEEHQDYDKKTGDRLGQALTREAGTASALIRPDFDDVMTIENPNYMNIEKE